MERPVELEDLRPPGGRPGQPEGEEGRVAPFNDLETTTAVVDDAADDLAAIIVEPLQRTIPPAPGFLAGLRALCDRHGIVLVFDEVVTGFRLAPGGAQERYGVQADLCALGKTISGGVPFGVLCGAEDLMAVADPVRRVTGEPFTMQTGTYSSNPIAMHVASAVLDELAEPGFHERLDATGRELMTALAAALESAGFTVQVQGEPSVFNVWFSEEPVVDHRSALRADALSNLVLTDRLLEHGVLRAHEKFFVSAAHDADDVEATRIGFQGAADALAAAL
ncbi:MAG: aminotransferase class III-fold pyridoxal phosphate-dependent enzyme [Actinomycetota bacterium]